ncbi:progranulin [Rhincodon typus]|uniref:progranulin n=1 Tax=Rhincodon typus TaxID=259920 RepID=UPI00202E4E79|nr:progranulin [Rhincodon typus]
MAVMRSGTVAEAEPKRGVSKQVIAEQVCLITVDDNFRLFLDDRELTDGEMVTMVCQLQAFLKLNSIAFHYRLTLSRENCQDENEKAIICPDGASECPDGSTCCILPNQQWGCCPLQKAVCCEDRLHCCPSETTCDLKQSKCVSQFGVMEMWKKFPALRRFIMKDTNEVRVVWCNGTVTCPNDYTCCRFASGDFGCCPQPNAVCCKDGIHCCPNGFKCDPETGNCYQRGIPIPWRTKTPAIVQVTQRDVQCDETKSCPDNQTCCKGTSGEWECCPIPQAVCCEDHIHCCPNGYTCDVQQGLCEMKDSSIPMVLKLTSSVEKVKDEICDDGTKYPSGSSCCRNKAGDWNGCPLPQAVCCDDHVHCCPNGYTCDVQAGLCRKGNTLIPLVPKIPTVVNSRVVDVQCDDKVACMTGTTCCRNLSGGWSCCPSPQAVCCEDKIHCCPNGYSCDVEHGQCLMHAVSLPWITNEAASVKFLEKTKALGTKCDDTMSCPSGNTCCKQRSGAWGCCPLTLAVCCEDHEHCCPHGYTCNVKAGTCEKQNLSVPWKVKHSPLSDVKCDDTFRCQSPATCCKISSGGWACCPYEQATCCEDQLHCCPKGYICNAKACTLRPQLKWDLFFPKKKKAFSIL